MASTTCLCCGLTYDDTYRDTGCPHATFYMHTLVGGQAPHSENRTYEEYVATTLDDLHAIQEYFSGRNSDSFTRIASQEHMHTRDMYCLTPNVSGRLVEGTQPSTVV